MKYLYPTLSAIMQLKMKTAQAKKIKFGSNKIISAGALLLVLASCTDANDPQLFSMNFSEEALHQYDYEQSLSGTSSGTFSEEEMTSNMHAKGLVSIDIKKDKTADLILSKIDMESKLCCINGEPMEKKAGDLPPTTLPGLKKDGSFNSKMIDPAFNLLFRLPKDAIGLGQKKSIPMQMPIRVGDWDMNATGTLKLTYARNEMFDGYDCAVLEGDIDISSVQIPSGLKGEVKCNNTGKVIYYFDQENSRFVKVDLELSISNFIRVDKKINEDLDTKNDFKSKITLRLRK